jgi:hypothetical protein
MNSHQLSQRINNTGQNSLLPGIVNIGRSSVCWRRLNGAARALSPPHSWPAELEAGHAPSPHNRELETQHEEIDVPAEVMDSPDLQPVVHHRYFCL